MVGLWRTDCYFILVYVSAAAQSKKGCEVEYRLGVVESVVIDKYTPTVTLQETTTILIIKISILIIF